MLDIAGAHRLDPPAVFDLEPPVRIDAGGPSGHEGPEVVVTDDRASEGRAGGR